MNNFLKPLFFLLWIIHSGFNGYAQLPPNFEMTGIHLIGYVNMEDQGHLFVVDGKGQDTYRFIKLDKNLDSVWDKTLNGVSCRSRDRIDMTIKYNNSIIYWAYTNKNIFYTVLDQATGKVIKKEKKIDKKLKSDAPLANTFVDMEGRFCRVHRSDEQVGIQRLTGSSVIDRWVTLGSDSTLAPSSWQTACIQGNYVYGYDYSMSKSFNKMKLNLHMYRTSGEYVNSKTHTLKLEQFAFTRNSSLSPSLVYVHPSDDGFYLFGKLDYHYESGHIVNKVGDGFIGFWWAKVNQSMELEYFREFSLMEFEGLIPNGLIAKPSVIDFKEDSQNGVFVNINVMPGVLYQQMFVIYLDSNGNYQSLTAGLDTYHFFEYFSGGYRITKDRCKVRLVEDDWRFYANKHLHLIKVEPDKHPPVLAHLQEIDYSIKKESSENEIYTFTCGEDRNYIFRFSKRNGGTLQGYYVVP